jgi:hypothetical protein
VYKNKNIYNSVNIKILTLLDSKLETKLTAETEMKHVVAIVGYFSMVTVVRLMISGGLWLLVLLDRWDIAGTSV